MLHSFDFVNLRIDDNDIMIMGWWNKIFQFELKLNILARAGFNEKIFNYEYDEKENISFFHHARETINQ